MAAAGWVAAWATGATAMLDARPEASAMVTMMNLPRWRRRFTDLILSVLSCRGIAWCGRR